MLDWNGHQIPSVPFEVGNDPEKDRKTVAIPCHCGCDWLHIFYLPADLPEDYTFDKRVNERAFISMFRDAKLCSGQTILANSPRHGLETCTEMSALLSSPLSMFLGLANSHPGRETFESEKPSGDPFPKEVEELLEQLGIKPIAGEQSIRRRKSLFDLFS